MNNDLHRQVVWVKSNSRVTVEFQCPQCGIVCFIACVCYFITELHTIQKMEMVFCRFSLFLFMYPYRYWCGFHSILSLKWWSRIIDKRTPYLSNCDRWLHVFLFHQSNLWFAINRSLIWWRMWAQVYLFEVFIWRQILRNDECSQDDILKSKGNIINR